MTEAMLIVAFLTSKVHPPLAAYYFCVSIVVTTIPWIAGITEYSNARKLRLNPAAGQEDSFVLLAQQFLRMATFSYAALVAELIFFTVLR